MFFKLANKTPRPWFFVTLVVVVLLVACGGPSNQETDSDGGQGSGVEIPSIPSTSEPIAVAVTPGGIAGKINDVLQSELEDALGVSLIVENFVQTATETDNVSLLYVTEGDQPDNVGLVSGFTQTVENLGGTVSFSMALDDRANVTFKGMSVGDLVIDGNFSLVEGKIYVSVSQISGA